MKEQNEFLDESLIENDRLTTDNHKPWGMELNQFCLLMHLSQFASWIIPFGGIVLPIVMWSSNKDNSETVNIHGKNILNWVISSFIYLVISFILALFFIGFILIIVIGILSIVFAIIGAIKASQGEFYEYPLSIKFFK